MKEAKNVHMWVARKHNWVYSLQQYLSRYERDLEVKPSEVKKVEDNAYGSVYVFYYLLTRFSSSYEILRIYGNYKRLREEPQKEKKNWSIFWISRKASSKVLTESKDHGIIHLVEESHLHAQVSRWL